jgi:flagellar basal body-associated protein FliL
MSVGRLVGRNWILLVAVVVIAVAGFAVYRLHGMFGSHHNVSAGGALPNDTAASTPKRLLIEVFGPPGAVASISYVDINAQPQHVEDVVLPWSYDVTTTAPGVFTNVAAQGNSDSLGCRITIDGEVKDERTVNTLNAYTYCLEKSG